MRVPRIVVGTIVGLWALMFGGCSLEPDLESMIYAQRVLLPEPGMEEGRVYALQYCQSCHLFVEPEMLPRFTWEDSVIPKMGNFLGMHNEGEYRYFSGQQRGRTAEEAGIIEDAKIYPEQPLVPKEHWDKLVEYLVSNAPARRLPSPELPPIEVGLEQLQAVSWPFEQVASTTLVKIDEARGEVLVGDHGLSNLTVLSATGEIKHVIETGTAPIAVRRVGKELWITGIGDVLPSDLPRGDLQVFVESDAGYTLASKKLTHLHRPTHTAYGDVNGDGIDDMIMSEFGNQVGRLSWYEGTEGEFEPHVLHAEPGSMTTHLYDFNDDGLQDIASVFGQNREGVHIFYNLGNGEFRRSYALQVPASYGSSHFGLYDFDGDGHVDILATHGDNGDHTPVLKSYHGVRIYLNNGRNFFEEDYFFPMNGAYKAMAEDFDGDGDLDIAAVSAFADYARRPEEGFVYLENLGAKLFESKFQFRAYSIPEVNQGHWLTMDVGDLDGDGDKDVVLGSFVEFETIMPPGLNAEWDGLRRPVLYLENQLK